MTKPADNAKQAERRNTAVALRREGVPYREIAARLGISPTRTWELVDQALSAVTAEEVGKLRLIEAERLDTAQMALWPRVLEGDPRAVDTFVRLSARRARMFGLDLAPDLAVAIEVREAYGREFGRLLSGVGSLALEPS